MGVMFRVTIFGESHGKGVGVVIEGVPPGILLSAEYVNSELAKRSPGGYLVSARREVDVVEFLSGVFNNYTTGAPLAMFIRNEDVDSSFYEEIRDCPRPGHADYVAKAKYMGYNDYRGGGMFSGRRTAALVAAGAVAKAVLLKYEIRVYSYVVKIGSVDANVEPEDSSYFRRAIDSSPVKCPDPKASEMMTRLIEEAVRDGDSLGGVVETSVFNVPVGLGEPPLHGLDSDLAKAVLSVPGVKGIEFGTGFKLALMRGSEANDEWCIISGAVRTRTNNSGGIIGGLSTGMPIVFRVVFKPTPTIRKSQRTINLRTMSEAMITGKGRHDPCIAVRGAPVIEAVTAIVLTDHLLRWASWRGLSARSQHNR